VGVPREEFFHIVDQRWPELDGGVFNRFKWVEKVIRQSRAPICSEVAPVHARGCGTLRRGYVCCLRVCVAARPLCRLIRRAASTLATPRLESSL
jgi:hypothetical protein